MTTEAAIEAILFFRGEPVSITALSRHLSLKEQEIKKALEILQVNLERRGITLITEGKHVALGTHKDASSIIENIIKEELHRDIGKAGLEVLSIVVYKGSVSKREIEYIRGVNSSYIIRNLMMRGLIEIDEETPKAERSRSYKPTIDLLSHLGVSKISDLPEYEAVNKEIENIEQNQGEETDGQ